MREVPNIRHILRDIGHTAILYSKTSKPQQSLDCNFRPSMLQNYTMETEQSCTVQAIPRCADIKSSRPTQQSVLREVVRYFTEKLPCKIPLL